MVITPRPSLSKQTPTPTVKDCIHDAALKGGSGTSSSGTRVGDDGSCAAPPQPETVMASLRKDAFESPRPSPVALLPPASPTTTTV